MRRLLKAFSMAAVISGGGLLGAATATPSAAKCVGDDCLQYCNCTAECVMVYDPNSPHFYRCISDCAVPPDCIHCLPLT